MELSDAQALGTRYREDMKHIENPLYLENPSIGFLFDRRRWAAVLAAIPIVVAISWPLFLKAYQFFTDQYNAGYTKMMGVAPDKQFELPAPPPIPWTNSYLLLTVLAMYIVAGIGLYLSYRDLKNTWRVLTDDEVGEYTAPPLLSGSRGRDQNVISTKMIQGVKTHSTKLERLFFHDSSTVTIRVVDSQDDEKGPLDDISHVKHYQVLVDAVRSKMPK